MSPSTRFLEPSYHHNGLLIKSEYLINIAFSRKGSFLAPGALQFGKFEESVLENPYLIFISNDFDNVHHSYCHLPCSFRFAD